VVRSMNTFAPVEVLRNTQHPLTDRADEFITVGNRRSSLRPLMSAVRKEHIGKEVRYDQPHP